MYAHTYRYIYTFRHSSFGCRVSGSTTAPDAPSTTSVPHPASPDTPAPPARHATDTSLPLGKREGVMASCADVACSNRCGTCRNCVAVDSRCGLHACSIHTVECDPFIKSQLVSRD